MTSAKYQKLDSRVVFQSKNISNERQIN